MCSADSNQYAPEAVSDGEGGAFVVWQDNRNGNSDIYIQRIDSDRNPMWDEGGVPICTVSGDQVDPCIARDGAGGVYVAWEDFRNGYECIYAQRVSHDGTMLSESSGVAVSNVDYGVIVMIGYPEIITDNSGNALIAWVDYRFGHSPKLFVQKVDFSGNTLWTENGVRVSMALVDQDMQQIVSDESGGGHYSMESCKR